MKIEIIILICLIILLIGYFAYSILYKPNSFKNEQFEKQEDKSKSVKYFGGDYCPFSNTDSNAYKVIKEFEDKYLQKVNVEYFWVGKDDNLMKELDVKYVPTILNGNNKQIELELPKDVNKENLSNNELKDILFENIYNKL